MNHGPGPGTKRLLYTNFHSPHPSLGLPVMRSATLLLDMSLEKASSSEPATFLRGASPRLYRISFLRFWLDIIRLGVILYSSCLSSHRGLLKTIALW